MSATLLVDISPIIKLPTFDLDRARTDAAAADLVERVLRELPAAVAAALAPVRAQVPALARALLVEGGWEPASLAGRLFPARAAEQAVRAVRALVEPGLAELGGAGVRLICPVPDAPADLAAGALAAAAEHRRTVLVAALGQRYADKYWQKAAGALWPRALPKQVRDLYKEELRRLTWTDLVLEPAGLGARAEAARCQDALAARLHGLLDIWQHRLEGALAEAVITVVYDLVDRTTACG